MGRPSKRQASGNTIRSQEISAIIQHSDHICQAESPHRSLWAYVGSVMSKGGKRVPLPLFTTAALTITYMCLLSSVTSSMQTRTHRVICRMYGAFPFLFSLLLSVCVNCDTNTAMARLRNTKYFISYITIRPGLGSKRRLWSQKSWSCGVQSEFKLATALHCFWELTSAMFGYFNCY